MIVTLANQASWLVPCNVRMFDVVKYLNQTNQLTVKQGRNIAVGDFAYIYVGLPYSRIMYRCLVNEVGINIAELSQAEDYAISKCIRKTPFMRLLVTKRFNDDSLNYAKLRANGLRTVQSQQAIPKQVLDYIQSFE